MTLPIEARQGLPSEMQVLLRDYPRDAWPDHPNFARSIQSRMNAHQMFRKLAGIVGDSTENYLERNLESEPYAERLGFYGNLLVRNLHGHPTWEDHAYFPELARADRRFEKGPAMLETDHTAHDALLDRIT